MSIEIVFETHSLTEDNEIGIATGWLDHVFRVVTIEHRSDVYRRRAR